MISSALSHIPAGVSILPEGRHRAGTVHGIDHMTLYLGNRFSLMPLIRLGQRCVFIQSAVYIFCFVSWRTVPYKKPVAAFLFQEICNIKFKRVKYPLMAAQIDIVQPDIRRIVHGAKPQPDMLFFRKFRRFKFTLKPYGPKVISYFRQIPVIRNSNLFPAILRISLSGIKVLCGNSVRLFCLIADTSMFRSNQWLFCPHESLSSFSPLSLFRMQLQMHAFQHTIIG